MSNFRKGYGNLILTRRPGEITRIGENISLLIMEINGKVARVRISAPLDVTILREEVYQRQKVEKEQIFLKERFDKAFEGFKPENESFYDILFEYCKSQNIDPFSMVHSELGSDFNGNRESV